MVLLHRPRCSLTQCRGFFFSVHQMKTNEIEIDVSDIVADLIGPHLIDHIVLFDPTVADINALAKLRPQTFIFSFMTGKNGMPDMTGIIESNWVVRPFWLGNIYKKDWLKAAHEIVTRSVWLTDDDAEKS